MFFSFLCGLKNLIIWFPVIWRDRWWDDHFLFVLLRFKLQLMEKNFRTKGIHVQHTKDADDMKKCILLLDRIISEDYHEIAFRNHDKKWGELNMSCEGIDNLLKVTRSNVRTKEDAEQERMESKGLYKLIGYLEKQDIEYLFHLLSKKINCWWD